MRENERAALDVRISTLEQRVDELTRSLLSLRELTIAARDVRFLHADGRTGDPRPSETFTRPVPGESPRCPTCNAPEPRLVMRSGRSTGYEPVRCGDPYHGDTPPEPGRAWNDLATTAMPALADEYRARVDRDVTVTGVRVPARPGWHDLTLPEPVEVGAGETLRIPVNLLSVPVPTPRPTDDLCRCSRTQYAHARSWCGTAP